MSNTNTVHIDTELVRRLITSQFPQWADLPITPIEFSGWDNRTFHLGENMIVRLPSAPWYAVQVEKEHRWLPKLAPHLPLPIPVPLAMGQPGEKYPWSWSIYSWLEGQTALPSRISNINQFARSLANFLVALQKIDATGGPIAGEHSFYRGGLLKTYDEQTRQAIALLGNKIDSKIITKIWEEALASTWEKSPVWVHGDVAVGNMLVDNNGNLSAIIDFGTSAVGDPACDLIIAWTLFTGQSREAFRETLALDSETWARGRGWALWRALIICAGLPGTNQAELEKSRQVIEEILNSYS